MTVIFVRDRIFTEPRQTLAAELEIPPLFISLFRSELARYVAMLAAQRGLQLRGHYQVILIPDS